MSHPSRLRMAVFLTLTAVAFPLTARAQEEFERYLTAASQLYESLEYERALQQLERAKKAAHGVQQDVAVALQEGIILADMGQREQSLAAFKTALLLDPNAALPMKVSPKVQKDFETVRARVHKELASRPQPPKGSSPPDSTTASALPWIDPRSSQPVQPPPASIPQEKPLASPSNGASPAVKMNSPTVTAERSSPTRGLIIAVAGGTAIVSGGVLYGLARNEQSRLRNGDPALATDADARRSASRGQTYQTLGVGLVGAGLVGLGISAALHLLREQPSVAVTGGGTDGKSAFIQGTWP